MRLRTIRDLLRDVCGAMVIETAIVTPVLVLMAIGIFEVGTMVSRQQELQSSASEAEGIILTAAAGPGTDSSKIEEVIEASLGLDQDQVTLEQRFRCNTASNLTTDAASCDTSEPIYQYVLLNATDSYSPVWANFGFGSPFTYNVSRTIQVQ